MKEEHISRNIAIGNCLDKITFNYFYRSSFYLKQTFLYKTREEFVVKTQFLYLLIYGTVYFILTFDHWE